MLEVTITNTSIALASLRNRAFFKLRLGQRLRRLPDRAYLRLAYLVRVGRPLSLSNPKSFNEKLQWLKLNYRDLERSQLVDKHDVKIWVAERVGEQYLIPTLGVWETVDEIDYDALPDAFVLKQTHDSGGIALVPDKSRLDREAIAAKLGATAGRSYFDHGREPEYRHVKARIIAEPYMTDPDAGQLRDYKFFCFDGEVKAMYVASDRAEGHVRFDYFDVDFQPLPMRQLYPNSDPRPPKPAQYDEMIRIARELSAGFPHVRVDLYEVSGRVYFGEMTFYHLSGMQPFFPARWDRVFGDWLTLPSPTPPIDPAR